MADKVSSGQGIPRSASLWNNIIDSANDFAMRRMGSGGGSSGGLVSTDIVKIRNSTTAPIRQGEVLEISGFLLTDLVRDSLWFDGDVPNSVRPFGIALQNIPVNTIDRCQVSGACIALVNVSDEDHGYAEVASGDAVLHSTGTGPVRILYKPSGTGEKTCAVLIGGSTSDLQLGKLDGSMSYEGSATVSIWDGTSDTSVNVTAYDWLLKSGQSIASGIKVVIAKFPNGKWYVIGAQCS